jgi:hypothetical protein
VIIRARLGSNQALVDFRGLPGVRCSSPEPPPVRSLPLTEQQVVRFPLNLLAFGKAQPFSARAPPRARRFPRLRGREIVPRVPVSLPHRTPDVVQVVALGNRRHHGHTPHPG